MIYSGTLEAPDPKRLRRRYRDDARCEDCGRSHATQVRFWVNAMPYRVCPDCIRAYRGSILTTPERTWGRA